MLSAILQRSGPYAPMILAIGGKGDQFCLLIQEQLRGGLIGGRVDEGTRFFMRSDQRFDFLAQSFIGATGVCEKGRSLRRLVFYSRMKNLLNSLPAFRCHCFPSAIDERAGGKLNPSSTFKL